MQEKNLYEYLYQEELYTIPGKTLVLLNKPWNELHEDDITLLIKILGPVKLKLEAIQIFSKSSIDIHLLNTFSPTRAILFGTTLSSPIKSYECITVDGFTVIQADALDKLNDVTKKNLWIALKQMFGF